MNVEKVVESIAILADVDLDHLGARIRFMRHSPNPIGILSPRWKALATDEQYRAYLVAAVEHVLPIESTIRAAWEALAVREYRRGAPWPAAAASATARLSWEPP